MIAGRAHDGGLALAFASTAHRYMTGPLMVTEDNNLAVDTTLTSPSDIGVDGGLRRATLGSVADRHLGKLADGGRSEAMPRRRVLERHDPARANLWSSPPEVVGICACPKSV
jgi:hypothetical protein